MDNFKDGKTDRQTSAKKAGIMYIYIYLFIYVFIYSCGYVFFGVFCPRASA